MKKLLSIILATMLLLSASIAALPAYANNHSDTDFQVSATSSSTIHWHTGTAGRLKQDTSSSYINYTTLKNGASASGPYKFEAIIGGSIYSNGPFVDWTTTTSTGKHRTKAVVTKGTKGFVRQDVYEIYGYNSYAQIGAKKYSTYSGTARGCWSPDSVGSYSYYNSTIN